MNRGPGTFLLLTIASFNLASLTWADLKIEVKLPNDHEFVAFESAAWPKTEPKLWKLAKDKDTVTIPGSGVKTGLFVVDKTAGRVATIATDSIKGGAWAPSAGDFKIIEKVEVEVSTPKGPIDAAKVVAVDGAGSREELIAPSSSGKASFWYVKAGDLKVTAEYKDEGKSASPVTQLFKIDAGGEIVPSFKLLVPGGSSSAPAKTETAKEDKVEPKTAVVQGSNPLGNILVTLFGLAFVGGAAFLILRYMRQNEDKVKDTLTKLGADIPSPGAVVDDSPPVAPKAPEPIQQIILDPTPVTRVTSAPVAAVSGKPTLVTPDGDRMELPDGETVVGREFGNGLVVPNDTVSRKHASLHKSGTTVSIQDHGSTNGTWVNGMKVVGSQTLSPGDAIRFGSVEYRFES